MTTKTFAQQLARAQHIYERKLPEWLETTKQYVPTYTAEGLFDQKIGKAVQMLIPHAEYGFIYDPDTLSNGIDTIIKVLIRKDYGSATPELIARLYTSFADAETRVAYLLPFVHDLNLYKAIGLQVIEDLKAIAPLLTDPEAIEINNNKITYIEKILGIQKNIPPQPPKQLF